MEYFEDEDVARSCGTFVIPMIIFNKCITLSANRAYNELRSTMNQSLGSDLKYIRII